jgi:putative hydrolase of the HAD superfamily
MTPTAPLNLVFDLGQVMIRWEPEALVRRFFPDRCGTDAQAQSLAQTCFRSKAWSDFDAGLLDTDGVALQLAQGIQEPLSRVRAMVVDIAHALTPIDASVHLLAQLHQWRQSRQSQKVTGLRLFYLSNMPEPYADHLIKAHSYFHAFDGGVFSGRVKLAKPDPAIYAHAELVLGLEPAHTVFLDDHRPNVQAANERGWQGVHVPQPGQLTTLLTPLIKARGLDLAALPRL